MWVTPTAEWRLVRGGSISLEVWSAAAKAVGHERSRAEALGALAPRLAKNKKTQEISMTRLDCKGGRQPVELESRRVRMLGTKAGTARPSSEQTRYQPPIAKSYKCD
jgi:hypothetical protein